MSIQRISGKDVRLFVGGTMLFAEKFDLKIDDKRAVALTNGVPNGYVDGETTASGSMTLDSSNFDMLMSGLGGASWKDIDPQDIQAFAASGGLTKDVNAYGCLLRISDLWSSESKGGEKMTHTIEFDVTSPDFVSIDGTPYLTAAETAGFF
jgi:hypothetical protein